MTGTRNPSAVRVLVAAAYPTTRAGLRAIVEAEPGVTVAGEVNSVAALTEQAETLAPDVLLVDPGDAAESWLSALWALADAQTLAPALLLTAEPETVDDALESGVHGFLLRDATADEIGAALRAVAAGLVVLDPRVADAVTRRPPAPEPDEPGPDGANALTARERQVLELIARGLPNKTIATELGISEHTVKFHVGSILAKLDASSRAEALARAARLGLIAL